MRKINIINRTAELLIQSGTRTRRYIISLTSRHLDQLIQMVSNTDIPNEYLIIFAVDRCGAIRLADTLEV